MDRLKHLGYQFYLGAWCYRKHISVEINRTPLVFGPGERFSHRFQHPQARVSNHQFYPIQTAAPKPLEEANPAYLVLLHALNST